MSLPQRLDAYPDCIDVFDRALEEKTRVEFETYKEAKLFQLRMCTCRALHRDETKRMYERTDPQWGRSPYDKLVVRQPVEDDGPGHWWVYIEPHGSNILSIEAA
jgi:hypothetical protein